MEQSEAINNKILEERQIEKFSTFIESYEADVSKIRSRLRTSGTSKLQAGTDVRESVSLLSLTDSDNGNVSKVILSLASVLEEVERLTRAGTTSLVYPLVSVCQTDKQQDSKTAAGSLLQHLQELDNYVEHCRDVLDNLLSQTAVLLAPSGSPVRLSPGRLVVVWDSLANLLTAITLLDVAVTHPVIQQHWLEYKRMVKGLRNEPEKFGSNIEAVRQLEKVLLDLEKTVMSGNMLQSLLSIKTDVGKAVIEEMTTFVRVQSAEVEREPGSVNEKFLSVCCLTALTRKVSGQLDRKIVSKLWDIAKKLPGCGVVSEAGVIWTPEKFFQKFLSQSADSQSSQEKKYEANTESARRGWFSNKLGTLPGEVRALVTEVTSWRARLTTRLAKVESNLQLAELAERTQMILSGLALANTSKLLVNVCLNFFTQFEQPLTKSVISSLGELIAATKMIQETFRSVTEAVTEVCLKSGQHAQFLVLNIIQGLKKGLVSDRKYSDERIDILSCLLIAEKVLAGPVTRQRTAVATIAITLASGGRFGVKEDDCRQMLQHVSVLEKLVNIQEEILRSCSTHFLFVLSQPHQQILSVILQGLLKLYLSCHVKFCL